jgi:hypothetical protein
MKAALIIQTAIAYTIVLSCLVYAFYQVAPILEDLADWFVQEEERESDG